MSEQVKDRQEPQGRALRYADMSVVDRLEYMREERQRLDSQLADAGNLIAALQIILWDLSHESLEGPMADRRDALVGIGNALQSVMDGSLS